jgi:hypothetical protein
VAIFLDEVMEVVRERQLDGDDHKGWVQIPAGNAWKLPKRIYVHRADDGLPVREIHLSGFCIKHDVVDSVSADEAKQRHLGRVRGIILARGHSDDDVLEALKLALDELGTPAIEVPIESEGVVDVPGSELPELAANTILDWIAVRLGYGDRNARAWFLGMEEACEDVMELPFRIEGGALEDLEVALERLGRYGHLLEPLPALQRTWAPLIRSWLVASSTDESPTVDAVRTYQRRNWGRTSGDTLLVELMPLPSPSLRDWPYAGLGIGTRAAYQQSWLEPRIELLARLWRESATRPRVAVAYGRSYWKHYRRVFGLLDDGGEPIIADDPTWAQGYTVRDGGVVLVRHPVAFGSSNARWESLGRWLRTRLAASPSDR